MTALLLLRCGNPPKQSSPRLDHRIEWIDRGRLRCSNSCHRKRRATVLDGVSGPPEKIATRDAATRHVPDVANPQSQQAARADREGCRNFGKRRRDDRPNRRTTAKVRSYAFVRRPSPLCVREQSDRGTPHAREVKICTAYCGGAAATCGRLASALTSAFGHTRCQILPEFYDRSHCRSAAHSGLTTCRFVAVAAAIVVLYIFIFAF